MCQDTSVWRVLKQDLHPVKGGAEHGPQSGLALSGEDTDVDGQQLQPLI